jgi:sugar phosphate isomerase/epimerase
MKRRDALRALSAAGVTALAAPRQLFAQQSQGRLSRIGLQLYTVRRLMERDVDGTLRRVADIGFREVEFAGHFNRPARSLRATLDKLGLTSPASHLGLQDFTAERAGRTFDTAATLGHSYVVIAWIDNHLRQNPDDWKRIADQFSRIGEVAKKYKMQFAYHNQEYDHQPISGRVPLDLLLESTDPSLVRFELDLYWITKGAGGSEWQRYFARWPGRFPMLHVKDSAGPPQHEMRDVGAGKIPFAQIFAQRERAGIQHFFVEHDEPADPLASIRSSYDYLRRLTF